MTVIVARQYSATEPRPHLDNRVKDAPAPTTSTDATTKAGGRVTTGLPGPSKAQALL